MTTAIITAGTSAKNGNTANDMFPMDGIIPRTPIAGFIERTRDITHTRPITTIIRVTVTMHRGEEAVR